MIEALNGPPQYSNTSVISSPMAEVDKLEDGGKLFEAIDKVDDGKVSNDIGKAKKNLKNAENEVSFFSRPFLEKWIQTYGWLGVGRL